MPLGGELLAQLAPARLLIAGRGADTASLMRPSCSAGVSPSGLLRRDAGAHLALEAGDADHEEFVEVVGRDRQEAHPLEQRMVGVLGLLQHAPVELQPGQFAVDEAAGTAGQAVGRRRRGRLGFATALDGAKSGLTVSHNVNLSGEHMAYRVLCADPVPTSPANTLECQSIPGSTRFTPGFPATS